MFCLIGTPIADLMMNSDSQFIYEKFNALLPAPSLTRNLNFFEKILSSRGFSAICFRSFSQVIFINNPVSGLFIFLAFWINFFAVNVQTKAIYFHIKYIKFKY